jgi:hypothetical protein
MVVCVVVDGMCCLGGAMTMIRSEPAMSVALWYGDDGCKLVWYGKVVLC